MQARSHATVEAIFDATIQVLLKGGARRVTTNHVAERAGISIGTLYQYFPGKEALLYALASRHLESAVTAVEMACSGESSRSLTDCSDAFVYAYFDAKAGDPELSRALYDASTDLNIKDVVDGMLARLRRAASDMLTRVEDARFDDIDGIVFIWVAIITGGTRQLFEEDDLIGYLSRFRSQLAGMSRAHLHAAAIEIH